MILLDYFVTELQFSFQKNPSELKTTFLKVILSFRYKEIRYSQPLFGFNDFRFQTTFLLASLRCKNPEGTPI